MKNKNIYALVLVSVAVVAVYFKTFSANFLPWDDDNNIFNNYAIQMFDWTLFWEAPLYGMYIPLTSSIWTILYWLGEGSVLPFRIFNLVLHMANCVFVFLILEQAYYKVSQRKSLKLVCLATFVFALHPVQVGTVAWISGGRDLVASFFALMAVWLLLSEKKNKEVLATLAFGLGLLCKPHIVTLPLAIIFVSLLAEPKNLSRTVKLSLGWLAMSFASTLVTLFAQKGAIDFVTPLWIRPALALDGLGFQLWKLVWPYQNLAVDYGRTPPTLMAQPILMLWPIVFCTIVLLGLLYLSKRFLPSLYLWIWFILMLPVCGLIPSGFQEISTVTDHYQYLPLLVVSFGFLILFMVKPVQANRNLSLTLQVLLVGLVASWGWASHERVKVWLDETLFFENMVAYNPNSFSAAIGLGNLAYRAQDFNSAQKWHGKALELRPYDIVALSNQAATLYQMRRYEDIFAMKGVLEIPKVKEKMEYNPIPLASFYTSLGSSAVALKELDFALDYLCKARQLTPQNSNHQRNAQIIEGLTQKTCP